MNRPRAQKPCPDATQEGSILIETMVATLMLAMILGAGFQVLGDAARRSAEAEAQRSALMIAQSRLAAYPLNRPVAPGVARGLDSGYSWQVSIAPMHGEGAFGSAGPMQVRVSVSRQGGDRPLVQLQSLRPADR